MTINLTQKRMINNFSTFTKGDFYWRLKNPCQHQGNPENETALTAKHKRVLPVRVFTRREHVHEIFTFLAVIYQHHNSFHIMGGGCFMFFSTCNNHLPFKIKHL